MNAESFYQFNVLDWWQMHESTYPLLGSVAKNWLKLQQALYLS
jgi:hypothetical protein